MKMKCCIFIGMVISILSYTCCAYEKKTETPGMNMVLKNLSDTALEELGDSVIYIGKAIRNDDVSVFIEASLADNHLYYVTFYVEGSGDVKPEVDSPNIDLIFSDNSELKTYVSYCSRVDIPEEATKSYYCLTYIRQTQESKAELKINSLFGSVNGKMFDFENEEPIPVPFRVMKSLKSEGDDVFRNLSLSPLSGWIEHYGITDPDHLKKNKPDHDIYICLKDNTRIGIEKEEFAEENTNLPFYADELPEKDHGIILIRFLHPMDIETVESIEIDGRNYKLSNLNSEDSE